MNVRILLCVALLFSSPLLGENKKVTRCNVKKQGKNILATCIKGKWTFAILHYSNDNIYLGQWRGTPHGLGFLFKKVTDPKHKFFGGYSHQPAVYQYGRVLKYLDGFDYDTGCIGPKCKPGLDFRIDGVGKTAIGIWKNKKLNGPGVQVNQLHSLDIFLGFWQVDQLEGDAIIFRWEKRTFEHGIWRKGKKVKSLNVFKFSK